MTDFLSICVFGSISYVFLSWVVFFYPNLLRKKKSYLSEKLNLLINSDKVLHISHRGGSREGLENTIEAFEKAVRKKYIFMLYFFLCFIFLFHYLYEIS